MPSKPRRNALLASLALFAAGTGTGLYFFERARGHLPAAEPVVAAEDLGLAAIVIRSQAAHDLLPVVREVLSRGERRHQPEV